MQVEITGPKQTVRVKGKFSKGASGNPRGRPKGSRNRTTQLCADLLADSAGEIMARVIRAAKKGEPVALRLAVERLIPARAARDRTVELELPAIARAADLITAASAVIERASSGDITLSEAKEFMQLIDAERKVIETADLAVRLEALEGGAAAGLPEPRQYAVEDDLAARVRRVIRSGGE